VQPVGLLTLNANPTNFFAEVEQIAYHVGHLVPGIDVTDDALLAGRLFSYVDTQITRLAGSNFAQIPINRTHAPVNDMLRDGFHQDAVHSGVAPYKPNSLDGGCPFFAGAEEHAFIEFPTPVAAATKVREAPASFDDHYSQPRLFWLSMSLVEREHIVAAYTFELGKCYEQAVKERALRTLAHIDPYLCAQVAQGLDLPVPEPDEPLAEPQPSPALSQIGRTWPTPGRIIGIVADPHGDLVALEALRRDVLAADMVPLIIAPTGGKLTAQGAEPVPIQRTFATARSVEFDAILLAGAPAPGADAFAGRDAKAASPAAGDAVDPRVSLMLAEAWRHAKAIGAWGGGEQALLAAGIPVDAPGVVVGEGGADAFSQLTELLATHRVWHRFPAPSGATG